MMFEQTGLNRMRNKPASDRPDFTGRAHHLIPSDLVSFGRSAVVFRISSSCSKTSLRRFLPDSLTDSIEFVCPATTFFLHFRPFFILFHQVCCSCRLHTLDSILKWKFVSSKAGHLLTRSTHVFAIHCSQSTWLHVVLFLLDLLSFPPRCLLVKLFRHFHRHFWLAHFKFLVLFS